MLCPMDRRMGSLACQPAVPHIPSGAFLSLGERTLVACTNGLSVKMDPNDVTGRAKKLEEKEGEELFRSALESARAPAWLGALLSVLSEEGKKGRKQFPSLQCPRLSSPLIVVVLLLLSPSCSPAAWSLPSGKIGPLSPSDRSAALPACVPWQMMHSDGPDEIVLPPLVPARLSASALLNLLADSIALHLSLAPCQY